MVVSKRLFFFSLLVCFFSTLYPVVKGSETVLSVEPTVTFPSADADNTMLGFGWFKNGFTLEDVLTTCTFDSVFPVSGGINLNGGTLYLEQDLELRDVALHGLGTIIGNQHIISVSPNLAQIASGDALFRSVALCCDSNLDLASTLTIQGNCSLCGNGKVLTLTETGSILIDSNSRFELRDVEIQGLKDIKISCVDDTSELILDNVRLVMDDSFDWKLGSIRFKDHVSLFGTSTFSYSSKQTSTIEGHSQFLVGDGMHICMGRNYDTLNDPLYFESSTAKLYLDNCNFVATYSGLHLTRGSLILDREVILDAMGTTTDTGIVLGDGNPANDITLWIRPGAALLHNSGYWVYNNGNSSQIKSSSKTSRMIRDLGSYIYIPQHIELNDITIELLSNYVTPLQVDTGKLVMYNDAAVKLPSIEFDLTSDQLNAFTYALDGNSSLFLTKGILPMYLLVSGVGNDLRGNGGFTGAITLSDSTAALTCGVNGFIGNSLVLNDGSFTLDYDLLVHGNGALVGPGHINLQQNQITIDSGFKANTPLLWEADKGVINLHGKVTLSSTWTIRGNCTFKGDTTKLVLADGGEIVVDDNSRLTFKDMKIFGLSDTNLRCANDTGVINYINSEINQNDNVMFDTGSMQFFLRNMLSGSYTFSYESAMTSTLRTDGKLIVRDGATLALGRNNGNEPLYFEDNTAMLKFDDAKLYVKETGMHFTRGRLMTSRDVEVDVNSTTTANGLAFGDGVAENDVDIILNPAAQARFTRGHVTYDITKPTGIISKSRTSRLIRYPASVFYLKHDLDLSDITIDVSPYSQLLVDSGKILSYIKGHIINQQDEFDVTGTWYNWFTMLLGGNGIINLNNGTFPLYILVQGAANRIDGVGNMGGVITLAGSTAELICNFNGCVFNSITMNNGKLTLSNNLDLANNVKLSGSGRVDMGTSNINLGKSDLTWADDMHWNGTSASINLNANISLAATWTFSGNCILKGNGHSLNLGNLGDIVVENDSQLCLQNIKIEMVDGMNIKCMGDTSVIILDDTIWMQDRSYAYTFTKGALRFKNKVVMRGDGLFTYDSDQTSTICAESQLKFDLGITCSINSQRAGFHVLEMEDDTATLVLQNASLHTTSTGIQLTKGNFVVKGESSISTEVLENEDDDGNNTIVDGGLCLGDGISEDNDCAGIISAGAVLRVMSGSFLYRNISSDAWSMENQLAGVAFYSGTNFRLYSSIWLGAGRILISEHAHIDDQGGNDIVGPVAIVEGLE